MERDSPPRAWRVTPALIFPSSLPWFLGLPILPLIGGIAILSFLIKPEKPGREFSTFLSGLPDSIFFSEPQRILIHLGDLLTYISAAFFHSILCMLAIGYFVYLICKLPRTLWWRALVFIIFEAALVVLLVWFLHEEANNIMLIQLGYKAVCSMLLQARLGTGIVGDCFGSGVSGLVLLAWIPTFLGMGAVLFAAAFAHAAAGGLPHIRDREWRSAFTTHIDALQRSFYVLSIVLVSSTLAILLFSHMPSGLLNPKAPGSPGLADAVSTYANGLVVLWGGIFTLTLISTFAPSAYLLFRGAKQHEEAQESAAEFRTWLYAQVFVSKRHQLGNVVTVLAPLMIGPVWHVLGNLPGG